jgi:hypothetical protein
MRLHDYEHNFTLEKDLCGDSRPRLSIERSSTSLIFKSGRRKPRVNPVRLSLPLPAPAPQIELCAASDDGDV